MSHISKASIESVATQEAIAVVSPVATGVGGRAWNSSGFILTAGSLDQAVTFLNFEEQTPGGDGFGGVSDGRYVVPVNCGGLYFVTATFRVVAGTPDCVGTFYLAKEGTAIPGTVCEDEHFPNSTPKSFTLQAVVQLLEGETVMLMASETSAIDQLSFTANECSFSVFKIGD